MGSGYFLEWVAFQIICLQIAMINNTYQIAGNSAFLSMCPMFNMFAIGVSMSVSSQLGNAIGQKKFKVAEKLIKLGFLTVSVLAISLSIISFFIEDFVAESLTTDDGMRTYFRITFQIFARYYIYGQYMRFILDGILKVLNQQNFVAFTTLFGYFILAIPLTYLLGF